MEQALPTLIILAAYLLGSIPFGLLITRCAGLGDIRAIGSGNIGATNVLRTGRKEIAAATLLLDGLKGACAVWIAMILDPVWADEAALAALLGHMFPLWLGFRGGKGVATLFGVSLALSWPVAVMGMLVWLASAWLVRISSLAALISVLSMPVFAAVLDEWTYMTAFIVMGLLVIVRHQANIRRLVCGKEPAIGKNKDAAL